jgi:protein-L-isoaspartate(D-aspartate) O-methyltransferase
MGYLAETIADLRLRDQPPGLGPAAPKWDERAMAEWLVAMPPSFEAQRLAMVAAIRHRLWPMTDRLASADMDRALRAMAQVPREAFACAEIAELAYLPMAHDIGLGQTISHPEMVAIMTAAAAPHGGHVLDVGTGSGYQAAVLAKVARRVTSVEIIPALAQQAAARLCAMGFANVDVVTGDAGATGTFPAASFEAIVVAAGAKQVPAELLAALKVGGRLVMPLGPSPDDEHLVMIEKTAPDALRTTVLRPAKFVPLTGQGAR